MSHENRQDRDLRSGDLRSEVESVYGAIARQGSGCGARAGYSEKLGYSADDLGSAPEGANLGLGCGNPTALAALEPGQVVLDLGSGAGFDAFLAAERVGPAGRVIGVDMTDDMLARARANARKTGRDNVEFRKGFIEELPVEAESVDVILSNCVINLSPDKPRVFAEAYRVLRPGGRLMISDLVLAAPLPEVLRESVAAYVGCIAGTLLRDEYLETVRKAGFEELRVLRESSFGATLHEQFPELLAAGRRAGLSDAQLEAAANSVLSLQLGARKPGLR